MPARFSRHARTLVTWPPQGELVVEDFRDEVETVVRAIARFEPVTLVVDPAEASAVRVRLADVAEIVEIPVDYAWIRDNGPIFVTNSEGRVAGVHFDFNGWGGKYPVDTVRRMPARVVEHLGMPCYSAGTFICEGGGISVDGEGTLITTEDVMANSNRYPGDSREDVERSLHDWLGIEEVIWLGRGPCRGHRHGRPRRQHRGVCGARSRPRADGSRPEQSEFRVAPGQSAAASRRHRCSRTATRNHRDGRPPLSGGSRWETLRGAVHQRLRGQRRGDRSRRSERADDDRGFRILEQAFPGPGDRSRPEHRAGCRRWWPGLHHSVSRFRRDAPLEAPLPIRSAVSAGAFLGVCKTRRSRAEGGASARTQSLRPLPRANDRLRSVVHVSSELERCERVSAHSTPRGRSRGGVEATVFERRSLPDSGRGRASTDRARDAFSGECADTAEPREAPFSFSSIRDAPAAGGYAIEASNPFGVTT